MNRKRVFQLASESLAATPAGTPPYDRNEFLYDLSALLADAAGAAGPATDAEWADAVVRAYVTRTTGRDTPTGA